MGAVAACQTRFAPPPTLSGCAGSVRPRRMMSPSRSDYEAPQLRWPDPIPAGAAVDRPASTPGSGNRPASTAIGWLLPCALSLATAAFASVGAAAGGGCEPRACVSASDFSAPSRVTVPSSDSVADVRRSGRGRSRVSSAPVSVSRTCERYLPQRSRQGQPRDRVGGPRRRPRRGHRVHRHELGRVHRRRPLVPRPSGRRSVGEGPPRSQAPGRRRT